MLIYRNNTIRVHDDRDNEDQQVVHKKRVYIIKYSVHVIFYVFLCECFSRDFTQQKSFRRIFIKVQYILYYIDARSYI